MTTTAHPDRVQAPGFARPVALAVVGAAVAAAVFALMAVNPLLAADQALTVVALELEHVAVAAVALFFLLPPLRARDRA